MEKTLEYKPTLSMKAVSENQVMVLCAEPTCQITIWIDEKEEDSPHKCISCRMRLVRDTLK